MAERYRRLYALPENLYTSGSPVLIQAGALLMDTQTRKVLAQLKLKNLYDSTLIACKVSVKTFDPSGTEVDGVKEYFYLDISADRGKDFGAQTPVYLPDNTTRKISVCVTEAVYETGEVWKSTCEEWQPLPSFRSLSEQLSDIELQEQYSIEVNGNCAFVPEIVGDLFLCTCGEVNHPAAETCSKCKREFAKLIANFDLTMLTCKRDKRLEAKKLAKAQHKKKVKKVAMILAGIFLLCVGSALMILNMKYNSAVALLEAGDYEGALAAFEAMGNYKDSSTKVLDCIIKQIDFEDGKFHSLSDLTNLINDLGQITNNTLQDKLESIPQVKTLTLLEGEWKKVDGALGLDLLVIRGGNVVSQKYGTILYSVFYCDGEYFYGESLSKDGTSITSNSISIYWRIYDITDKSFTTVVGGGETSYATSTYIKK